MWRVWHGPASQEKKIIRAVRSRLPQWIEQTVQPVIEQALVASGLQAELSLAGKDSDKLTIPYPAASRTKLFIHKWGQNNACHGLASRVLLCAYC